MEPLITREFFLVLFEEFKDVDSKKVEAFILLASNRLRNAADKWGDKLSEATAFLAAHMLSSTGGEGGSGGGVGGQITSESVGDLSRGYSPVNVGNGNDETYALTRYGLQYLELRRSCIVPATRHAHPHRLETGLAVSSFRDKDFGYRRVARLYTSDSDEVVKIGIISAQKHDEAEGLSVADVAAIHEFGAGNTPERPFMRSTMERNQVKFKMTAGKLYRRVLDGGIDQKSALGLLGLTIEKAMKATITAGNILREKAASTLKRNPSKTTPLVDTGQLLSSITHEVGKGE